ncbi:MAG: SUMF1/EgtB/PvdO family nonheme iron enzyme [Deltaproteobacteria bacterium]|nr:SUMF1/EgtB/PvdO family nonheme iron enzyme [Deltaproteobacteria bacterium]
MGLPIQNQGFGGAPAFYPEEITQVDTKETSFIASDVVSTQEPARPPYVLGLLAGPQFKGSSVLKNIEGFIQLGEQATRPLVSRVDVALGGLLASSFGTALGMFVSGPAPFIEGHSDQDLDFTVDRLKNFLKPEEVNVLVRNAVQNPEHKRRIEEILAQYSGRERVVALLELLKKDKPDQHACPDSMVYVSQQESGLPEALCVDQDDHPDLKNPKMPRVSVTFREAIQMCELRHARLPAVEEYQAIASFGRRQNYPTLDKTTRGVHFNEKSGPRVLGFNDENAILYMQPNGQRRPIYNLTGNVRKWLANGSIGGGSWRTLGPEGVHALFRTVPSVRISSVEDVGFRCVTTPQKISR